MFKKLKNLAKRIKSNFWGWVDSILSAKRGLEIFEGQIIDLLVEEYGKSKEDAVKILAGVLYCCMYSTDTDKERILHSFMIILIEGAVSKVRGCLLLSYAPTLRKMLAKELHVPSEHVTSLIMKEEISVNTLIETVKYSFYKNMDEYNELLSIVK